MKFTRSKNPFLEENIFDERVFRLVYVYHLETCYLVKIIKPKFFPFWKESKKSQFIHYSKDKM